MFSDCLVCVSYVRLTALIWPHHHHHYYCCCCCRRRWYYYYYYYYFTTTIARTVCCDSRRSTVVEPLACLASPCPSWTSPQLVDVAAEERDSHEGDQILLGAPAAGAARRQVLGRDVDAAVADSETVGGASGNGRLQFRLRGWSVAQPQRAGDAPRQLSRRQSVAH